jgi:hypothetical protein
MDMFFTVIGVAFILSVAYFLIKALSYDLNNNKEIILMSKTYGNLIIVKKESYVNFPNHLVGFEYIGEL